jgi:molybdenum cofactor cytidylyltransferase
VTLYTGLLTAAGYSKRMGKMKALLPWHGTSLLSHQIDILRSGGCEEIIVILGYRSEELEKELKTCDVSIVKNDSYQTGRASSIKKGISAASDNSDGYVLLGVDQPRTSLVISKLLESHKSEQKAISSPRFKNKGGHPIVLSSAMKNELLDISEDSQGIRQIFEKYRNNMNQVIFNDPIVCLDVNTYEEYRDAFIKYGE